MIQISGIGQTQTFIPRMWDRRAVHGWLDLHCSNPSFVDAYNSGLRKNMLPPDLIARHQIVLHDVRGSTRWESQGSNAWFGGVPANELVEAVSQAFEFASIQMARNLKERGLDMKQYVVEAAALRTIISVLCQHKRNGVPLVLTGEDLSSSTAKNQCAEVCQAEYGNSYSSYASALLGVPRKAFDEWEEGQRRYIENVRS